MFFKGFHMPISPSYEYVEEVHPTAFVRSNASNCRAAARDAECGTEGGVAGADMGGGGGTVGLVCAGSVLGSGFAGAVGSVVFLRVKRLRPILSSLFVQRCESRIYRSSTKKARLITGIAVAANGASAG